MTDQSELLAAAIALLPYLKASTDHRDLLRRIRDEPVEATQPEVDAIVKRDMISPADRLREQALELEAKDAAILRFRAAVEACKE